MTSNCNTIRINHSTIYCNQSSLGAYRLPTAQSLPFLRMEVESITSSDVSVGCYGCCMWGHHSWSLQTMCAALKEIFPRCVAMEIIRCDIDENLCPPRIFFFHGCYFVVILYFCGNLRNMKCTVIVQARFHFTCNTFVHKYMYCINTNAHTFFLCTIDFSTNIWFCLIKT